MNAYLLFRAVLAYAGANDPIGEEQYCDAVVVCAPHQQSCNVLVWGECKWTLEECLESTLETKRGRIDVLGCAPHVREVDVDRNAAQRLAPQKGK